MRTIHALPLAAAILLAACGGDADADGDGKLSAEEVAAEADGAIQMRPGQYRASMEVLDFEAPGVPASAKEQMRKMFASEVTEGITFCMTEEDAARGREQMVQNLAEGDCTTKTFNVSGSSVVAEMQCDRGGGMMSTVKMDGVMTAEGSTMTMETSQQIPNAGTTSMKMRVKSERIGDCAT